MEKKPLVMRTFLFVPGHIDQMLEKALRTEADCIALCLEDAVPVTEKADARIKVRQFLEHKSFAGKHVFVRINPIESGLTLLDLGGVACDALDGFVYPMANTADDIKKFDAQLSLIERQNSLLIGHFSIVVLVETPLAVLNAYELAMASDRVVALLFGCEDYMAEMESRYSENEMSLFVPRSMVAMASRAAGVEAIDTPYVNIHDLNGLRRFASLGRDLGMSGMLVMSPRQIPIVRECYTPSTVEIENAEAVVEGEAIARKQGKGIVVINDRFVSPPTIKQSKKTLARFTDIQHFENKN
ncbi:CoA ester lyase [Desulfuromonas acetoxidans]|uniref:HpcH/HpaI aldolase/citrate lyase family protein n=1 Tax=Desulfuromonas acetoxidans TaxID=891 RepID=UPI002930CA09|nr:CoA ester lyase [Desulfuromonas acetoxidans]